MSTTTTTNGGRPGKARRPPDGAPGAAAREPAPGPEVQEPGTGRGRRGRHERHRRTPRLLIWRRLLEEELCRLEHELVRAKAAAPTSESPARAKDRHAIENLVSCELERARSSIRERSRRRVSRLGDGWSALVSVWTGSEMESGWAALHRAERLLLLIAPSDYVLAEYGRMRAVVEQTAPSVMRDPRYTTVLERFQPPGSAPALGTEAGTPRRPPARGATEPARGAARGQRATSRSKDPEVSRADRAALAELRRRLDDDWELARARIRIFRNVLTAIIVFLVTLLTALCLWAAWHPGFVSLRGDRSGGVPKGGDIATVVMIGAFGGLLSSIAGVRRLRDFERDYGLPLGQLVLKIPMGGALALAAILLLQHGAFGNIEPVEWESVSTYALLFGIAQVAVTGTIDSRATDLLEAASATEPGGLAKAESSASST